MALFDAQVETLAGDAAAAERAVREAERITSETGDRWFQATVNVALAHAPPRAGRVVADETRLLTFRADAHRTLAEILALVGDGRGAASEAGEALRLYEAKGNAAAATAMRPAFR